MNILSGRKTTALLLTGLMGSGLIGSGVLTASTAHGATKQYTLKSSQVAKGSNGKLCGLIEKKWQPVKKTGKKYTVETAGGSRCKSLLSPDQLSKKGSGLSKIPGGAALLRARAGVTAKAVTGTPPALKDIPEENIEELFWAPGLIDAIKGGVPTQQQCNEFFTGANDGESSGLIGCYSVQSIGYAFQAVLEGGTSVCYMKNMPTKANLDSGAVNLVSGTFPDGKIANLFSTPTGSKNRVVKLLIEGPEGSEVGFIAIDSASRLADKGLQYGYSLWFCNEGDTQPNNYERSTVSLAGEYKYVGMNLRDNEEFRNEITAQLVKSGNSLTFDLSRNRVAKVSGEFGASKFKGIVTVLPTNVIENKVKEVFEGNAREAFTAASFSGTGFSDFSVDTAALKEVFTPIGQSAQTRSGGVEYRDPRYVSAPATSLLSSVTSVDFDSDSFFGSDASVEPDFTGRSCTASPDVVVSINFASAGIQAVAAQCEGERFDGMDFCREGDVALAFQKCALPPG